MLACLYKKSHCSLPTAAAHHIYTYAHARRLGLGQAVLKNDSKPPARVSSTPPVRGARERRRENCSDLIDLRGRSHAAYSTKAGWELGWTGLGEVWKGKARTVEKGCSASEMAVLVVRRELPGPRWELLCTVD